MRVLVTGGSGYIGSHTCVQLLQNGHDVIILDNLCNSKRSVLPVIERLGGKHPTFVEGDIRNEALMTEILHDHAIDTVIHFAGLKAVLLKGHTFPFGKGVDNLQGLAGKPQHIKVHGPLRAVQVVIKSAAALHEQGGGYPL